VAARFWIYQRRDPTALIFWGVTAVIMVAVSVSAILGRNPHPGILIVSAIFGAAFVGIFHANAVGWTGPPFVLEAMALHNRDTLRAYLSGQNIVLAVIAVPLLTVISFGLALLARHPEYGLLGMAVDLAGIGAALGLGNLFTVTMPFPIEKRAGSPIRTTAAGYTSYGIAGNFGSLFGVAVAVIPVIIAIVLTGHAPAAVRMPVLVLCAAGYGLGLAWIGVRIAARAAEQKLPELCQVAVRSKL
jgi:ABC-2 type transport system permease protein